MNHLRAFSMLVAAALAAIPGVAAAQQKFPTKPIRLVVPFSPGAAPIRWRASSRRRWAQLGQSVVIETVPGGRHHGTALVAKATPDGYTLLVTSLASWSARRCTPALPTTAQGLCRRHPARRFHECAGREPDPRRQDVEGLHRVCPGGRAKSSSVPAATAARRTSTASGSGWLRDQAGAVGVQGVVGRRARGRGGAGATMSSPFDYRDAAHPGREVGCVGVIAPTRSPLLPDVPTFAEVLPATSAMVRTSCWRRPGRHVPS